MKDEADLVYSLCRPLSHYIAIRISRRFNVPPDFIIEAIHQGIAAAITIDNIRTGEKLVTIGQIDGYILALQYYNLNHLKMKTGQSALGVEFDERGYTMARNILKAYKLVKGYYKVLV